MLPLALTLAWFVTGYILAQRTLLLNCRKDRLAPDSVCVMALLFFAVLTSFFGPLWLVGLIVELRRTQK